ncbi:hypothetical protein NicSoilC12_30480 [Arthrobacter sp. NicSoilC12]|nr:hypothetical protein NicSoilC12_30480 [Arthrobacter sp. NicSoilC12]
MTKLPSLLTKLKPPPPRFRRRVPRRPRVRAEPGSVCRPAEGQAVRGRTGSGPGGRVLRSFTGRSGRWGRVEGDGHVFLTVDGTEYPVGQYPGVSEDEALGYFARKFEDVVAQIVLLEQR